MRRHAIHVAACALSVGACAGSPHPKAAPTVVVAPPAPHADVEPPEPVIPEAQREADARALAEQNAIASRTDLERLEQELTDLQRALLDADPKSEVDIRPLREREAALAAQVERLRREQGAERPTVTTR